MKTSQLWLWATFCTLLLCDGIVTAIENSNYELGNLGPNDLESSAEMPEEETKLDNRTEEAEKRNGTSEGVMIEDEFGGGGTWLDAAELGEQKSEETAEKEVVAAARRYTGRKMGGQRYGQKQDDVDKRMFYANSPLANNAHGNTKTNLQDDFYGRGRVEEGLRYVEKGQLTGRQVALVDEFIGSNTSPPNTVVTAADQPVLTQQTLVQNGYVSLQPLQQQQQQQQQLPVQSLVDFQWFTPTSMPMQVTETVPVQPQPVDIQSSTPLPVQQEQDWQQPSDTIFATSPLPILQPAVETDSSLTPLPIQSEESTLPSLTEDTTTLLFSSTQQPLDIAPSSTEQPLLLVSEQDLPSTTSSPPFIAPSTPLPVQHSPPSSIRLQQRPLIRPVQSLPTSTPVSFINQPSAQVQSGAARALPYAPELIHPETVAAQSEVVMVEQLTETTQTPVAECTDGQMLTSECSDTFYICIEGKLQELACASPQVMNPVTSSCANKQEVAGCAEFMQMQEEETVTIEQEMERQAERREQVKESEKRINQTTEENGMQTMSTAQPIVMSSSTSSPSPSTIASCIYSPDNSAFSLGTCTRGYYICTETGQLLPSLCLEGELFDEQDNRCVSSALCARNAIDSIVKMANAVQGSTREKTGESDDRCSAVAEGTILPIGKCLSSYILCTNGTALTKNCQSSTEVFSTAMTGMDGCILRVHAPDCNSELPRVPVSVPLSSVPISAPLSSVDELASSPNDFCSSRNDGLYRNAGNCSSVLQCFGGDAFVYSGCTSGLVFNEQKQRCDYRVNVPECDTEGGQDVPNLTSSCSMDEHGAYIPDSSDCSVFYRCVWGRLEQMHCPSGTLFNSALSICDWPSSVPNCNTASSSNP